MNQFETFLKTTGEVGTVEQVFRSIVYVTGLPTIKPQEVVLFESGGIGTVLSITAEYVEVLLLTADNIRVGSRVTGSDTLLTVEVGSDLLGRTLDPLGLDGHDEYTVAPAGETRYLIDNPPDGIGTRQPVTQPLETGVGWVDLVLPLGLGQRELVLGDRKVGKTQFLLQAVLTHAKRGGIVIYAAIAKRQTEIKEFEAFFERHKLDQNLILVASTSADASGMIFLTPYTAMSIAEYFRHQGLSVLVVMDDLSIHAKYYREINLLARRFPGRNSYPGDIFYAHSRLLERAGNFTKGVITCLPVAEATMGDLSGYIQTNLMSMTDGHIFFDAELYNQGRRPAVNPFLSVTRVGHQTQTALLKSLSREISSFMAYYDRLQQLLHFGGELTPKVRQDLNRGDLLVRYFNQLPEQTIPLHVNAVYLASLFADFWGAHDADWLKHRVHEVGKQYLEDRRAKDYIDAFLLGSETFNHLVDHVKQEKNILMGVKR
jgi:F-type H+/Na+-transporting ATPase subunit alpha